MTPRRRTLASAAVALALVLCGCESAPYEQDSAALEEYLEVRQLEHLNRGSVLLLVMDGTACAALGDELLSRTAQSTHRPLVLTGHAIDAGVAGRRGLEVATCDESGALSRLSLAAGGATLVSVRDGRVVDLVRFTVDNVAAFDSCAAALRR